MKARLEALMLKLKQLEEGGRLYKAIECPLCDSPICQWYDPDGCFNVRCVDYVIKELGLNDPEIPPIESTYLQHLERSFWISHCLREIRLIMEGQHGHESKTLQR